jgi:hypothetical protein
MAGGRPGASPEIRQAAAERQRQVMQLRIRGITFEAIGRQLGCSRIIAFKVYRKALRAIPKADVDEYRKLEAERIADLRQRIWSELAGRPDPNDPTKTIRPDPATIADLTRTAIRLSRHEAILFGMDEPSRAQVVSHFSNQPISDEELDAGLARLTEEEQETFMMLLRKLQGRWVEPPPASIETTASPVSSLLGIEPPKNGSGESNG